MNTILYTTDASSPSGYRQATFDEIITGAKLALSRRFRKGALLDSPTVTRNFLTVTLGHREFESFCCIFVDNRHRVIGSSTSSSCSVARLTERRSTRATSLRKP